MTIIASNDSKSFYQAALDGQNELKAEIAKHHVAIHELAQQLEQIGGKMDYQESILEILKVSTLPEDPLNPKPLEERSESIHQVDLNNALGDPSILTASRDALYKSKRIDVISKKNRKILKLLPEPIRNKAESQLQQEPRVPAAPTSVES